ncbi:MAG: hypothetical protein N2259_01710 [Patescibacteria group bacterium]|nr:hypothetical protein [Patescibacteria group bacterium]
MKKTKIILIRHPEFSYVRNGSVTEDGKEGFRRKIISLIDQNRPVLFITTADYFDNSPIARTHGLVEDLKENLPFMFSVELFPEFGPLQTKKLPTLFGGRLFDLLHRSKIFTNLSLFLWLLGLPVFTEPPMKFRKRVEQGIQKIKKLVINPNQETQVIIIGHQELVLFFWMILDNSTPGEILTRLFRQRVKNLDHFEFYI